MVQAVKREADVPVLAKLTSDVTDVVAVARAVVDAGADGLTLINTLLGMAIDAETGPAAAVQHLRRAVGPGDQADRAPQRPPGPPRRCPTSRSSAAAAPAPSTDVIEFLRAGASAVQVGTATFVDPFVQPTRHRRPAPLARAARPSVSRPPTTVQVVPW